MSLLDEAAPLAADSDVAVEIAHLRGHVALARGDAMLGARRLRRRRAARAPAEPSEAARAVGRSLLRGVLRRACASRCSTMPAPLRAALPGDDDGVEACTARLALGMALVLLRRRRRGAARAARPRPRCAGYAQLLDGPPLMWRWAVEAPLFLREARTARESFTRAHRTSARERGVAGALCSAALPARARRGDDRSLARGPRAATTKRRARPRHGTARRGVRRALGLGLARGTRRARGQLPHARRRCTRARARSTGAGFYEAWALAALGDLELALGRPAEAVERLTE